MLKYPIILLLFLVIIGSLVQPYTVTIAEAHGIEAGEISWMSLLELLESDKTLYQLAKVESGLNPNAINPKDTDGLSKHGLFQYDFNSFFDVNKVCKILPDIELQEVENVIYDSHT